MEQTLNLTINRLPALTWHHLGMNQTSLEQVLAEGEGTLTIETPDGVTQPAQDALNSLLSSKFRITCNKTKSKFIVISIIIIINSVIFI